MITIELQSQTNDEQTLTPEESRLLDSCMDLGQTCWEAFRKTARAAILLLLLPSDDIRNEANRLFQVGERAVPSQLELPLHCNNPLRVASLEFKNGNSFIFMVSRSRPSGGDPFEGEANRPSGTDLDGEAYPATGKSILQIARFFFTQGFIAGNVAARECMKGH